MKVGTYKCGNLRCQIYTSIQVTKTFSSFVTKSAQKNNHNFNCSSKCIIYLLSCKKCGKQYTGKIVDMFMTRWNNCKTDARKAARGNTESCKQQLLQNHFLQDDYHGFLEETSVHQERILLDETLKTLCFDGLDLESDCYFLSFLVPCTCLSTRALMYSDR